MYGGYVEGVGPRYCPSIEDKIVKFADKDRHQIFLEPESIYYDDIYIQGFSTSMPHDIQEQMVHSLPGLENAKIVKYAYAIEYDAIDSKQLKPTLETKIINNLYTAGQINGTSGYEEAAGQGIIAGINAALKLDNKDPLILGRDEAYIGVLIDDLVTKGVIDPYRLLTSRAEYRLLLRHDNADMRLMKYGKKVGLLSDETYEKFEEKLANIEKLKQVDDYYKIAHKIGVNFKGVYGKTKSILGSLYTISNSIMLGRSESNIIQSVESMSNDLSKREYESREVLKNLEKINLEDEIFRSLAILSSARVITNSELMQCLSNVKLGIEMGYIEDVSLEKITKLMTGRQPYLKIISAYDEENKIERATYIRREFSLANRNNK